MKYIRAIYDLFTGRWYRVYTGGHGSRNHVADTHLTQKREAMREVDHWIRHADTIGGTAEARNIFTNEIVYS